MSRRSGLGKGLEALFQDNNTENGAVTYLRVTQIEPNRHQPRTDFEESALRELADSIRQHGVIQPLIVRSLDSGGYQIVAGERRWRASRMAGLAEVPVIIRTLDDGETLELAMIENLQREDLNIVEMALGYQALMAQYGFTQEQLATKLGKSRPVIANTLRLLTLPQTVLEQMRQGKISPGHARALVALDDPELIDDIARKVVEDRVLVRDIEKMARQRKQEKEEEAWIVLIDRNKEKLDKDEPIWGSRDRYYREVEMALETELGRKVVIEKKGKKRTLTLEFYSDEELSDLIERLAKL